MFEIGFCCPQSAKVIDELGEKSTPSKLFFQWNCLLLFLFFHYANNVKHWKLLVILAVQYWLLIKKKRVLGLLGSNKIKWRQFWIIIEIVLLSMTQSRVIQKNTFAECILIDMEYSFIFKYWRNLRYIFGAHKVKLKLCYWFLK